MSRHLTLLIMTPKKSQRKRRCLLVSSLMDIVDCFVRYEIWWWCCSLHLTIWLVMSVEVTSLMMVDCLDYWPSASPSLLKLLTRWSVLSWIAASFILSSDAARLCCKWFIYLFLILSSSLRCFPLEERTPKHLTLWMTAFEGISWIFVPRCSSMGALCLVMVSHRCSQYEHRAGKVVRVRSQLRRSLVGDVHYNPCERHKKGKACSLKLKFSWLSFLPSSLVFHLVLIQWLDLDHSLPFWGATWSTGNETLLVL